MRFSRIKLEPKGPFTCIPGADTLFGAIANAVSWLYGEEGVKELVEAFMVEARISSAFPYVRNSYYLPKPLTVELVEEDKRIKRAKYLDVENFERALRLEHFEVPAEKPFERVDVPRVSLDRVTQNSSLYFWEEIRFRKNAGLYFLYSGPEEIFRDFIKPAIRLLGDTGIGGKSTWGFGLFKPSFDSLKIEVPESSYAVTLSNALPVKRPVLWLLLRKSGWSRVGRRPKLSFIAEGSIVKNDLGRIETLNISSSFTVYVYGKTFPVPVLLPEGLS